MSVSGDVNMLIFACRYGKSVLHVRNVIQASEMSFVMGNFWLHLQVLMTSRDMQLGRPYYSGSKFLDQASRDGKCVMH